MSCYPSTSSTTATVRKCINITILLFAFFFPLYNSQLFTSPPRHLPWQLQAQSQSPSQFSKRMSSSASSPPSHKSGQNVYVLDFDGTITTADTTSVIFESAVRWHGVQGGKASEKEMREKLNFIYAEYDKDYIALEPAPAKFKSLKEFVQYQRSLKEVEERSFERVSQAGILGKIGKEGWGRLGAEAVVDDSVVARDGWEAFLEKVRKEGTRWGIVSVSFCDDFIRGVLGLRSGKGKDRIEVLANSPDRDGILYGYEFKGKKTGVMVESKGKRDALRILVERLRKEGGGEGKGEEGRVVYFGDSATDVECLTEDGVVGIVMTKADGSSKLLDILKGFGEGNVRSIGNYDERERRKGVVYFAKDYREIVESPLFRR